MTGRHHHRLEQGADLAEAARAALEGAGEQWTPMRASVFGVLSAFDRPATAYDVADSLSQSEGRRIAPNSIYRILDLFVARNLAQRIETANAYVANAHPACRHDCMFLVCEKCGQTTHIDDDVLTTRVRDTAIAAGFQPVRPVIEVKGRCRACAGA
ncbi:Fur family transcriptional regulator [Sphingomonas sp.]|uniref:Fur family transcriptional regulator n=1 Tax=Sphingomonas sp. TaxID=28214 RepID=UPI003B3B3C59